MHNFPAVDAILICLDGESAEVFGVQITIANAHPNSEDVFFRGWDAWLHKLDLPEEKVKFGFVWIREDTGDQPREKDEPLKAIHIRGQRKVVRPAFKRVVVSLGDVDREIGRKLQAARHSMQE